MTLRSKLDPKDEDKHGVGVEGAGNGLAQVPQELVAIGLETDTHSLFAFWCSVGGAES